MLLSSHHFHGAPLMSLQTGTRLGTIDEAIINPRTMSILAYYVDGPTLDAHPSIIRIEDIREIGSVGFIIDSSDDITAPEDIVRLQQIIDLRFTIVGLKVYDEKRRFMGRVLDYNMDATSFEIRQFRVRPPLIKLISISELLIHRDQIVKVTNDRIIVKSGTVAKKAIAEKSEPRAYTNPFRSPHPESSQIKR